MSHISLTEEQFFDIIRCSVYYDIKHNKGISPTEGTFKRSLNSVANFFYVNLLDQRVLAMSKIKDKWDKVAEKQGFSQKQVLTGMSELMKFGNWMSREQPIVVDVNSPYRIIVDNIEIIGNTGILFYKDRKLEMVYTDFSQRSVDQKIVDMKLKYTMDAYVYQKMRKEDINGMRVHSVKHNKDILTSRGEQDFERMERTITSIGKMLREDALYPNEGPLCSSCPVLRFCKYWA